MAEGRPVPGGIGDAALAAVSVVSVPEGLAGTAEVDGDPSGRDRPWLRDGRLRGKSVLTGIAIEGAPTEGSAGAGWPCWPTAQARTRHPLVTGPVESSIHGHPDVLQSERGLDGLSNIHERRSRRVGPHTRGRSLRTAARRAPGDRCGELLWRTGGHQIKT